MPSKLYTRAQQQGSGDFAIDWRRAVLHRADGRAELQLPQCTVLPEQLLLTAGAGNEALMAALGSQQPAMQRRPLQQVILRHEYQPAFYGHCLGATASPRLTISSHRDREHRPVWYLGGDLATGGGDNEPGQLIDRARTELTSLLPWIDFGRRHWATVQLDRAEPRQSSTLRPDRAFVEKVAGVANALVAWPTKLTLTPDLASQVQRQLEEQHITPKHPQPLAPLAGLTPPPVATSYWDRLLP